MRDVYGKLLPLHLQLARSSFKMDASGLELLLIQYLNGMNTEKFMSIIRTNETPEYERVKLWSEVDISLSWTNFVEPLRDTENIADVEKINDMLLKITLTNTRIVLRPILSLFSHEDMMIEWPQCERGYFSNKCPANTTLRESNAKRFYTWRRVWNNVFASDKSGGRIIQDIDVKKEIETKCKGWFGEASYFCEVKVEMNPLYFAKENKDLFVKVESRQYAEEDYFPTDKNFELQKATTETQFYKIEGEDHNLVKNKGSYYERIPTLTPFCLIETDKGLFQCIPHVEIHTENSDFICDGEWVTEKGEVIRAMNTVEHKGKNASCIPKQAQVSKFKSCYVMDKEVKEGPEGSFIMKHERGKTYVYFDDEKMMETFLRNESYGSYELVQTVCIPKLVKKTKLILEVETIKRLDTETLYQLKTGIPHSKLRFSDTKVILELTLDNDEVLNDSILNVGKLLLRYFNAVDINKWMRFDADDSIEWYIVREEYDVKRTVESAQRNFKTSPDPLIYLAFQGLKESEEKFREEAKTVLQNSKSLILEGGMLGLLSFIIHLPALFPTSFAYLMHKQLKNAVEHHLGTSVHDQLTALELQHGKKVAELLEARQTLIDDHHINWFQKQNELSKNFYQRRVEDADFLNEKREIYAHHAQEQALYDGGGVILKKSKELNDFVEVKGTNAILRTLGFDNMQLLDVVDDETREVVHTAADVLHSFVIHSTTLAGWATFTFSISLLARRIFVKIERDDLLKRMTWNKTHVSSVVKNLKNIEVVLQNPTIKMEGAYLRLSTYLGEFEKCYSTKKKCYKHDRLNCQECTKLKVSRSLAIVLCHKLVRNLLE